MVNQLLEDLERLEDFKFGKRQRRVKMFFLSSEGGIK